MSEIQQKIEALLDLARAEADQAKSRIADDLSEIIYVDGAPFSERELDIATDILRRLVRQTENAVRQRMAERLAQEAKAAPDVGRALANHEFTVQRPNLASRADVHEK